MVMTVMTCHSVNDDTLSCIKSVKFAVFGK